MFEVRITAPAEDDIQQNFIWWRDNRDPDQATSFIPTKPDLVDRGHPKPQPISEGTLDQ